MHSRSLCPGKTEVHPALLSHHPVNLFPLTASLVSGSPPPPIPSLSSSILTRPSSRCDLLISRVLMLSHPRFWNSGPWHLLWWPRPRSLRPHGSVPAQPASNGTLPQRQYGRRGRNSTLPSPRLLSSCNPGAPAGTGWIRSRARCRRSSPGRQQPSPKKAKHRLCLHLSVHSQAVKADCRSPFHGSDSRKALQDGINPFCTGAE